MPYRLKKFSQRLDVAKEWRRRSCGVVALVTVMNFYDNSIGKNDLRDLIISGEKKGYYKSGVGWYHEGLVKLARQRGFSARRRDYFKETDEFAFKKIILSLKKGPIIVSVYNKFKPGNGGHLIVVAGFDEREGIFYINDPDAVKREKISQPVSRKKFLRGWKRRFIIIQSK